MLRRVNNCRKNCGYSLIELLVVLAILGVLSIVGMNMLTPKSPSAVRTGTFALKEAVRQAQELAISSGREITLTTALNQSGRSATIQAKDPQGNVLMDWSIDKSFFRNAQIVTTAAGFTDVATDFTGLTAAGNYGFGSGSSAHGWDTVLFADASGTTGTGITFTPAKDLVLITTSGGTTTRTTLSSGFWIGVLGTSPNQKGLPAGIVLVSATVNVGASGVHQMGTQVVAYYTGDTKLTTSQYPWQRLE
jgi:prepilin-type N-terminal cleavage/methylation domain-containing protein